MQSSLRYLILSISIFICIAIIFTGCAQIRAAKKPVIVEPAKPVPAPEPPPPPPPPEPVVVAPPPAPEPVVVVTPPPPPPPPKPVPPPPKKPAPQFGTIKTPPVSILGKRITAVDILSTPNANSPVVTQVADKTRVQILSKIPANWYKIKLLNGTIGWISGNYIVIPTKTSP
ncbi:MAG: SH3 domain-containing protein [bacterium]